MINQIQLDALYKIQYGMYIITTKYQDKINGQIATTLFQITNEPIKVAICLSKNTYTHELILQSKVFGATILEQDTPMKFVGNFGYRCGKDCDKFSGINYETNITGSPLILDHAVIVVEGAIQQTLDVVTHTMFIAEVLSAKKINERIAMTYEYYHTVIKGKSPKKCTNVYRIIYNRRPHMQKFICQVCGYIYDPKIGDPDDGIEAGTLFENLPEDWICPICSVGKEEFTPE